MHDPDSSILITAYREPKTIGRALEAILSQVAAPGTEIIVICPDDETAQAALMYPAVTVLRDEGRGKPAALNLGLSHAHGKIVVMTDGDVWIGPASLNPLLALFDDPSTGAVSGRPISVSPRGTMLGYWSHLLTDAGAHAERSRRDAARQFLVCSGYLYAVRAGLVMQIPEEALAEDAVVSQMIAEKGYRVRYTPQAQVFVRYPTTYRDWLIQKVRSTGGYTQPVISNSPHHMRGFWQEATVGLWRALAYPRTWREFLWTLVLMAARLHLWLLVLWNVGVTKRRLTEIWKRVESTK